MNPSLFILLDFYDGPVEGFMKIAVNVYVYFKMLAWDDQQDYRIFSLANISPDCFVFVANILEIPLAGTAGKSLPRPEVLTDANQKEISQIVMSVRDQEYLIVGSADCLKTIDASLLLTAENLPIFKSLRTNSPKPDFVEWKRFLHKSSPNAD